MLLMSLKKSFHSNHVSPLPKGKAAYFFRPTACRPERVQEISTTHARELNWSSWRRSQSSRMHRGNLLNEGLMGLVQHGGE